VIWYRQSAGLTIRWRPKSKTRDHRCRAIEGSESKPGNRSRRIRPKVSEDTVRAQIRYIGPHTQMRTIKDRVEATSCWPCSDRSRESRMGEKDRTRDPKSPDTISINAIEISASITPIPSPSPQLLVVESMIC
jgi:hypothetical protein